MILLIYGDDIRILFGGRLLLFIVATFAVSYIADWIGKKDGCGN